MKAYFTEPGWRTRPAQDRRPRPASLISLALLTASSLSPGAFQGRVLPHASSGRSSVDNRIVSEAALVLRTYGFMPRGRGLELRVGWTR